jgi:uncharacterized SAM-binding protein YcdF (DUF218 family)
MRHLTHWTSQLPRAFSLRHSLKMFVFLSKTLDLLLSPLTWCLLLLVPAAWRCRLQRPTLWLVLSAFVVLWLFGNPAVANALMGYVESSAETTYRPNTTYDAVIVLGGAVDAQRSQSSGQLQLNGSAERILQGYELVRTGRARNILLSAGALIPLEGVPTEAEFLARQLRAWNVPADRIYEERLSRNTRENAVESARIVAAQGWQRLLLVTSAAHMSRALGCFRAAGLAADALPVDHRGADEAGGSFFPRSGALSATTESLRELFGRAVYRLWGFSTPEVVTSRRESTRQSAHPSSGP